MCWHKWGKWQDVFVGRTKRVGILETVMPKEPVPSESPSNGDLWIEQKRVCEKCGMVNLRTEIA